MKLCLNNLVSLRSTLNAPDPTKTNVFRSTCGAATSTCTVDLTEQISGMCVGESTCSIPLIGNLGDCSGLPGQVGPGSILFFILVTRMGLFWGLRRSQDLICYFR